MMDIYFAVFNCHVNNALERATGIFKQTYNDKKFEKQIQPFIDKGIMSLFHEKPNRYTLFFASYIKDIVNGTRH